MKMYQKLGHSNLFLTETGLQIFERPPSNQDATRRLARKDLKNMLADPSRERTMPRFQTLHNFQSHCKQNQNRDLFSHKTLVIKIHTKHHHPKYYFLKN